jgi:hypothetical protein
MTLLTNKINKYQRIPGLSDVVKNLVGLENASCDCQHAVDDILAGHMVSNIGRQAAGHRRRRVNPGEDFQIHHVWVLPELPEVQLHNNEEPTGRLNHHKSNSRGTTTCDSDHTGHAAK